MKFCTNCGAQLPEGTKFCTECGQRIEQAEPAAQAPKSEAPAAVYVYGQPVNHTFSEPVIPETEQGVVHTYSAPVSHSFATPVQAEAVLSGTYGGTDPAGSVEPEPVPAQEPIRGPEPVAAPAPACAEAVAEIQPPVVAEEKNVPMPKTKKRGGSKILRIAILIAIVGAMIIGLFSCLGGGGDSKDPNLGLYNGISCTYSGMELGAEGEWIELKSGGKLKVMLLGEQYSGKWELDGTDLTVTQAGDVFYGTLKDGVIILDFAGMVYTYEKEVVETENEATEEPAVSVAAEVGYWTLKYSNGSEEMTMDEETVALLKEMGIEIYVDLKEDGTGIFMLDDIMPITWGDGKLVADDGSEVTYALENGELIVDIEGTVMHFVPGEKGTETEVPSSGDLLVNEITYYMAISGNMSGTEMNDSAIAQMGGMDIALNGDGTGTLNMFGSYEEITYDNDMIYRSGVPMEYELDGYYLYLKVSDGIEFTMMVENKAKNRPKDELTPNDLFYWKGDYYGWWVFDNVIEGNTDAQGNWWDCCMTLDIFTNGVGYITIWDEEYGKDDPIAKVEVSVSVTDGVARIVSESGDFMGCEVKHADWLFYSDSTGYEDTLGFSAMYEDPDTKIDCYFFLRQWGTIWDDVEEKDLPGYYESWYLPLIEDGEVIAPKTIG